MNKKWLFMGGIVGPLVFLLNDIIGSIITKGYSPIINAVSELTQTGAENAILCSILFFIAASGLVLFSIAMMTEFKFKQSKLIFIGSFFIMLLGILSALTGTIFPMDPFGEPATFPGDMHKWLTMVNIGLIVLGIPFIGIGIYIHHRWKGLLVYTIIAVILMISGGFASGILMSSGIELLGLFERITIYAYQTWIVLTSIKQIKNRGE